MALQSTEDDDELDLLVMKVAAAATRRRRKHVSSPPHSQLTRASSPEVDVDAETEAEAADCLVTAEPKLTTRWGLTVADWEAW